MFIIKGSELVLFSNTTFLYSKNILKYLNSIKRETNYDFKKGSDLQLIFCDIKRFLIWMYIFKKFIVLLLKYLKLIEN